MGRKERMQNIRYGGMNIHTFADKYSLREDGFEIPGPLGQIEHRGDGKFYCFRRDTGYRTFNPVTQAKWAIEAIGLEYTAPAEEIKAKQDRRAFLIVKRADGWYIADKAGPFKTRELARMERERLNDQQETPKKTT